MNDDYNETKKKIELAFPSIDIEEEEEEELIPKGNSKEVLSFLSTSLDNVADWFKNYQIESIELNVSGVIETSGITKLVVSAKGEGGMKVVLKPKPSIQQKSS